MKALLKKDFYMLTTQLKMFIVLTVVFALLPNDSMNAFAVVYASMLPYSAIAYDERSKWDRLAAMMPYSTQDLVLSKYVLGYLSIALILAVTLLVKLVSIFILRLPGDFQLLLPLACVGLLILAVSLPFMMRFGVEKGRMIFTFGIIVLAIGSSTFLSLTIQDALLPAWLLQLALPAVAVVGNVVSVAISIQLYPRRSC